MMYDMHCHLDLMPNMKDIIRDSLNEDLGILAVTTTPKAYKQEINFCKCNSHIKVALGLHPQLVKDRAEELTVVMQNIPEAKYIGEIGLDFNRMYYASRNDQIYVFSNVISACSKLGGKTISIHSVRSSQYVIDILESLQATEKNSCILHWFSGGEQQLIKAIKLGCYFSVNAKMLETDNGRNILKAIPENRLLVETDAPFIKRINYCYEIYEELEKTVIGLSELRKKDLSRVIHYNSCSVIGD